MGQLGSKVTKHKECMKLSKDVSDLNNINYYEHEGNMRKKRQRRRSTFGRTSNLK